MYATSHKRPFVPSVGGIRLLCNVEAQGPVSFVKRQRSPTGDLIPLDSSITFFQKVCGKREGILTSPHVPNGFLLHFSDHRFEPLRTT